MAKKYKDKDQGTLIRTRTDPKKTTSVTAQAKGYHTKPDRSPAKVSGDKITTLTDDIFPKTYKTDYRFNK